MPEHKKTHSTRRWLRVGWAAVVLLAVGGASLLGWRWQQSLRCERIRVEGARQAGVEAIRKMARVDTSKALYSIQPLLIEDRVRRHPWIRAADVSRWPTGTLWIHVEERTPAAIALQEQQTAYYLDAQGYQMPLTEGAAYDVPLVRGLDESYHPLEPIESEPLRSLLSTLGNEAGPEGNAPSSGDGALPSGRLISEIRLGSSGAITLQTVPVGQHGSASVRLGTGPFEKKLAQLAAFWRQAVMTQPRTAFRVIDLRFDGQIITEEKTLPEKEMSKEKNM